MYRWQTQTKFMIEFVITPWHGSWIGTELNWNVNDYYASIIIRFIKDIHIVDINNLSIDFLANAHSKRRLRQGDVMFGGLRSKARAFVASWGVRVNRGRRHAGSTSARAPPWANASSPPVLMRRSSSQVRVRITWRRGSPNVLTIMARPNTKLLDNIFLKLVWVPKITILFMELSYYNRHYVSLVTGDGLAL